MKQKWLMSVATLALIMGTTPIALAGKHVSPGNRSGGMSSELMGPVGMENSNAQNQEGATRGLDRAQERMSDQGRAHSEAGKKDKGTKKAKKAKKEKKAKNKYENRDQDDRLAGKRGKDETGDMKKDKDNVMEKEKDMVMDQADKTDREKRRGLLRERIKGNEKN